MKASRLRGNEKVLDVGCGIGTLCKNISPLLNKGGKIIGIDVDEELINYGKNNWGNAENIQLDTGNAKELPYANQSFDLVVSMGLVENSSDPKTIFSEMLRVTTSPGRILIIHIDIKNYSITPSEPHFNAFYKDLLRGMEQIGVDIDLGAVGTVPKDPLNFMRGR